MEVSFFEVLFSEDGDFLRLALVAGLLASIAFAVTGTYIVVRRSTAIAGAIAHSVLGGIGFAIYAETKLGWTWLTPIGGAFIAALASAVAIGTVTMVMREREDTVIAAMWATGMAVGFLFIKLAGTNVDGMSYLMGNILLIDRSDVVLVAVLDVVVVAAAFLFNNRFTAICFDEEFAQLRGVKTKAYYLLLLCLTGLSIVALSQLVGIVMVIALLVIPAAIASQLANRLWQMMVFSAALCMVFIAVGTGVAFHFDLATGPAIILTAATGYLVGLVGQKALGR